MRPKTSCEHHDLVYVKEISSRTTKRYRCIDCDALLYNGKPKNRMSQYDIPEKELSVYTCAFTKRIEVQNLPDGEPIIQRVRVCTSPGQFLCNRKRGHAYCEQHYNPKTSKEEIMRKKIEKERDEQGKRDVEAFDVEAKRLREELAGNAEQRSEAGLFREEVEEKENFVSGVILL